MNTRASSTLLCLLLLPACDDPAPDAAGSSTTEPGPTTDDDDPAGSTTSPEPEPNTTTGMGDADPTDDDDGDDPTDTDAETTGVETCGGERVPCEDAMLLDLGLVAGTISSGVVTNLADGDDWVSSVDATAGGIVDAPTNPWIYLRFTDDGLEQVSVDDLDALASTDWHIAAKRFGLRLNGGSSGPGCVTVAALPDAEFTEVEALPADATLEAEAFYDDSCTLVDDGSGAGGADYALTPWWFYPGCVGVTYVPFVIALDDGRHVKFVVESYYESGQAECNDSGAMGSGSANYTWRWTFLD